MRYLPRSFIILHSSSRFTARVRECAGNDFSLREVDSWPVLYDVVSGSKSIPQVIVDPYFSCSPQDGPAAELHWLLRRFRASRVIAALEIRADRLADLRLLGEWGVQDVISTDDALTTIAAALRRIRGRVSQKLVSGLALPGMRGRAKMILSAAASVATDGGGASELASFLHVSERTLLRWCQRAELPQPRQILVWMRILIAAELLDDDRRSVEGVAAAAGYSSGSGLRRALMKSLGVSPKDLRELGAFAFASEKFREELNQIRAVQVGGKRAVYV